MITRCSIYLGFYPKHFIFSYLLFSLSFLSPTLLSPFFFPRDLQALNRTSLALFPTAASHSSDSLPPRHRPCHYLPPPQLSATLVFLKTETSTYLQPKQSKHQPWTPSATVIFMQGRPYFSVVLHCL